MWYFLILFLWILIYCENKLILRHFNMFNWTTHTYFWTNRLSKPEDYHWIQTLWAFSGNVECRISKLCKRKHPFPAPWHIMDRHQYWRNTCLFIPRGCSSSITLAKEPLLVILLTKHAPTHWCEGRSSPDHGRSSWSNVGVGKCLRFLSRTGGVLPRCLVLAT